VAVTAATSAIGDDVDVIKFTSLAAVVCVVSRTVVIDGLVVVAVRLVRLTVVVKSTNVIGPVVKTTSQEHL